MKIRTDFVTNSSSSSFVAVNIQSSTLSAFLQENTLSNRFFSEMANLMSESEQCSYVELTPSITDFLLKLVGSEADESEDDESQPDSLALLSDFLEENQAAIDAETGKVEIGEIAPDDIDAHEAVYNNLIRAAAQSPTLVAFLKEHDLVDFCSEMPDELIGYDEYIGSKLTESCARDILAMVKACSGHAMRADSRRIAALKVFLQEHKAAIDAEAQGSIILHDCEPEDGFAYYQKLEVSGGHGRLIQWPCARGWTGEGYAAIQEYNENEGGGIWEMIENYEEPPAFVEEEGTVTEF